MPISVLLTLISSNQNENKTRHRKTERISDADFARMSAISVTPSLALGQSVKAGKDAGRDFYDSLKSPLFWAYTAAFTILSFRIKVNFDNLYLT